MQFVVDTDHGESATSGHLAAHGETGDVWNGRGYGVMGKLVPYQLPAASLTPSERLRIEREIYRLIGLLDAVDGDADFEDGGDFEPSLSAYARFLPGVGLIEDCELDECDRESTGVTVPVGAYHI